MTVAYASTGLTQTGAATNTTLSAAVARSAQSFSVAITTGIAVGQMVTAPDAMAGLIVTGISGTTITVDRFVRAAVANGTAVSFADATGVLSGSTGLAITDVGTLPNRQRIVALNGSGTQFSISGEFNIDALRDRLIQSAPTNAGWLISGAGAVLNIAATDTGHHTGTPLSSGGGLASSVSAAAAETFSGAVTVNNGGVLRLIGGSYYGNRGWTLGALANAGTIIAKNCLINFGYSSSGIQNTLYNASNAGAKSLLTFDTVQIAGYLKLLAVDPASTFTNVRWFKDRPVDPTYSASDIAILLGVYSSSTVNVNTQGITLFSPRFGIQGKPDSYYNVHIGIGNVNTRTEGPTAVRNAIYGYEKSVLPIVGKAFDFPNEHRPWFEFRRVFIPTVRNQNGSALGAGDMGFYLEDPIQHTGSIQIANITAQGTGYTNGTYDSAAGALALPSGGTQAILTVTVAGGAVTRVDIKAAGSGYVSTVASPLTVTVNATNFPGIGAGTGGSINCFASNRYTGNQAAAGTGCPDMRANRVYAGSTVAGGVLTTSSTNSRNDGTTTSGNPAIPSGSAFSGIDLLWAIANCAFTQTNASFGKTPIDTRFGANGAADWSVTIPLRGYAYQDTSFTFNTASASYDEVLATSYSATIFATADAYIVATGITAAMAATYTDVTLVTPAPTRGALQYGDTTGPLIQSTTGTLTVTGQRSLDQIFAKSKLDYVQPTLDTAAGAVAHTGFGIAAFLSTSGTLTNGIMSVGSWAVNLSHTPSAGTVIKTLSTTGSVTVSNRATVVNNPCAVIGNNVTFDPARAAFTTNNTLGSSTGNSTFTLSNLPAALAASGSITTASIAITGTTATDQTTIGNALRAVLPGWTVTPSITQTGATNTLAVGFIAPSTTAAAPITSSITLSSSLSGYISGSSAATNLHSGVSGTIKQDITATGQLTTTLTEGELARDCTLNFANWTIPATGDMSMKNVGAGGTLTVNTATLKNFTLEDCTGPITINVTGGGSVRVICLGTTQSSMVTAGSGVTVVVAWMITMSTGAAFNLAARYGTTGAYTNLAFQTGSTSVTYYIPPGQPLELIGWSLGYVTYGRTITAAQTATGGTLAMEMTLNPNIDTSLDVSSYLVNLSLSLDTSISPPVFVVNLNAAMVIPDQPTLHAILHRLSGQQLALMAGFPPGSTSATAINAGEVTINLPQARLAVGAGVQAGDALEIRAYINVAPALAISLNFVLNPRRADGKRVEILQTVKPALDPAYLATAMIANGVAKESSVQTSIATNFL